MRFIRLGALIGVLTASPVWGQPLNQPPLNQPMTVTTDTEDYCEQLVRKVSERASRAADVVRLLEEGRQMCDHGEIRGGIVRLRRALVLLNHRVKIEPQNQ